LAKSKMITRWRDRTDRRIVRVKLTDKGEQLYRELAEKRQQFEKKMLQNVTEDEKQTFLTVITKMQEQLNRNYGDLLPKGRKGCDTDD
jgi:DNA-binding MarR family transcriptional regulator